MNIRVLSTDPNSNNHEFEALSQKMGPKIAYSNIQVHLTFKPHIITKLLYFVVAISQFVREEHESAVGFLIQAFVLNLKDVQ